MLLLSVAGNLRPTLEYLRDKIGVEPVRLGWALGSNPMLFSVSLTGFLQKNVRFYNRDLRIPHRTLGTMIGAYPALLTLSIENNVMPKIELLVESMGLSMSRATKLIIDTPAVLGRSRYSLWSSCYVHVSSFSYCMHVSSSSHYSLGSSYYVHVSSSLYGMHVSSFSHGMHVSSSSYGMHASSSSGSEQGLPHRSQGRTALEARVRRPIRLPLLHPERENFHHTVQHI